MNCFWIWACASLGRPTAFGSTANSAVQHSQTPSTGILLSRLTIRNLRFAMATPATVRCGQIGAPPAFKRGKLSLPNVVAAGTRHGVGRVLLGQLLLADWAGFSHHVGHSLRSEFLVSSGMRLSLEPDATNRGPACLIHIAHILAPSRADATDLSW